MGLFDSFSTDAVEPLPHNWQNLTSEKEWEAILAKSYEQPIAVFKHSTRCGISAMTKFDLEQTWDINQDEVEFHYLDLIRYRNVSNRIAEDLGVWHQSPQLILIQNGKATYQASHAAIKVSKLKDALVEA